MFLQLYNLSGEKQKIQGVSREIQAHADVQLFQDIDPDSFSYKNGVNLGVNLLRAKTAGLITYDLVPDAGDYTFASLGGGVKTLTASFAAGDFDVAAGTVTVTDDVAIPDGAILMSAQLVVTTICIGGGASSCVVDCGYTGGLIAFDENQNVFVGATTRSLTDLAQGTDIGGKFLALRFNADVDMNLLTQGSVTLKVAYLVLPA